MIIHFFKILWLAINYSCWSFFYDLISLSLGFSFSIINVRKLRMTR